MNPDFSEIILGDTVHVNLENGVVRPAWVTDHDPIKAPGVIACTVLLAAGDVHVGHVQRVCDITPPGNLLTARDVVYGTGGEPYTWHFPPVKQFIPHHLRRDIWSVDPAVPGGDYTAVAHVPQSPDS